MPKTLLDYIYASDVVYRDTLKMINLEWDENKRNINVRKHGIDFIDAIEIFHDPAYIESEIIRDGEKRYQAIGIIHDIVVLVIYTNRNKKGG